MGTNVATVESDSEPHFVEALGRILGRGKQPLNLSRD
jgi:hypothetical protein